MGHNDHINFELLDRIQNASDLGFFDEKKKELGIALFAADGGQLSPAQQYVLSTAIAQILAKPQNFEEEFQQACAQDRDEEWADTISLGQG